MSDNQKTILIVDDSISNLEVLRRILKPDSTQNPNTNRDTFQSNYTLCFAESGLTALKKAIDEKPDLILLDVILPDINGFDVLSMLKKSEKTCDIPVIFITGMSSAEDEEMGLSLGAVDYITKPFNHSIVRARVKTHLQIVNQMRTIKQNETSLNILKSVLDGIDNLIYVTDPATDELLFVNKALISHFKLTDDVIGKPCWKIFQNDFNKRCDHCSLNKLFADPATPIIWEGRNAITGGYYRNIDRIIDWIDGKKVHFCQRIEMTEMRQAQQTLLRMSSIVQSSPNFISYIEDTGECTFVNSAASTLTGYTREELMENYIGLLFDEETAHFLLNDIAAEVRKNGSANYEVSGKRKNGETRIFSVCTFLIETEKKAFGTVATDITEMRRIELIGLTDTLTSLPNRRSFDERISMEWKKAVRDKKKISLLMIDIDHFKVFNDTYGHQNGDVALQTLADVIKSTLKRPADFAARWGGEEFTVILPDTDIDGALKTAEKIRENVEMAVIPSVQDASLLRITVSIGAVTALPDADSAISSYIAQVDKALYAAKEAGRNRVRS